MSIYEEQLNTFLVNVFNNILRLEEACLAKGEFGNLSINEMHVIEAVYESLENNSNSMAEIASRLMVTASTLTTSVKTLEQKGYLLRTKMPADKRKVIVTPTPLSEKAYKEHKEFHKDLVARVSKELSEEEMAALTQALCTLDNFFKHLNK